MLKLYDVDLASRLLLGTARYPSPAVLAEAVRRSKTDIVTVSLRRETAGGKSGGGFFELIRALGVRVLPNTAGCRVLMPWCAPIGSAIGPVNPMALRAFRAEFPDVPLIVDAGIGRPSHAAAVMELGYDAVLLNTAVAGARDPAMMAEAFAMAIDAGRLAHDAVPLIPRGVSRCAADRRCRHRPAIACDGGDGTRL